MTIRRMHIACWIAKATDGHLEHVIHITLPQKQWLHERASMLRYTNFACLVKNFVLQFPQRGGAVAEALRYKPEGRGIDSRWCHWNFSLT
jgi:hypothetical protein